MENRTRILDLEERMSPVLLFLPLTINISGNGLILGAICFSKRFRKPVNCMIGNLLATTILCSLSYTWIFAMKLNYMRIPEGLGWTCYVIPGISLINRPAEVFSIISISMDRCRVVQRPWDKETWVEARTKVIMIWILSAIIELPKGFFWTYVGPSEKTSGFQCKNTKSLLGSERPWVAYVAIHVIIVYILPSILLVKELFKLRKILRKMSQPCPVYLKMVEYHDILRINARERSTALRNAFLFISIFALLKVPCGIWYELYQLPLDTFSPAVQTIIRTKLKNIIGPFILFHFSIYPCVIFYLSQDIREHYLRLFCWKASGDAKRGLKISSRGEAGV